MRTRLTFLLPLMFALVACSGSGSPLADASARYKAHRDYASLATIHSYLSKGMPRAEVERLLGEADYSPTNGQYYYASDRKETAAGAADRPPATFTLVVDYRGANGTVTPQLQRFTLGPIGE